jgi:hypothetical protein
MGDATTKAMRKGRGGGRGKPNAVREAVEKVGGIVPACALLMVSNATLHRWLSAGSIPLLVPALKLARASGIAVERFALELDE